MSHVLQDFIKNLSVDCVVFGFEQSTLEVLLVRRAQEPGKGMWALPGGFVNKDEYIMDAAARVLQISTGVNNIYLEEVGVFDQIDRFPLWRVFTIGFFALISPEHYEISAGKDTMEVKWFEYRELPDLPFDHKHIINNALIKLRERVQHKPIGFELLPKKFTLPQLQILYEVILDKHLDKRNFRKKLIKMNLLRKLNEKDNTNRRRAANLYKFDQHNYYELVVKGISFEL